MFDGPEIPMMVLFVSIAAVFILRGQFGRALAERISGRARPGAEDQDVRELKSEVEELRTQLGDVQERLDFAERVLARRDDRAGAGAGALPKGAAEAR